MNTRIVAMLLIANGKAVITRGYKDRRYIGDPRNIARIFSEQRCDELAIKNINDGEVTANDLNLISEVCAECMMPVSYGGNISDLATAKKIIDCGADKIIANRAYLSKERWIHEFSDIYGEQALVVSVDYLKTATNRMVYECRTRRLINMPLYSYLMEVQKMPVGEMMVSCVNLDGSRRGLDREILDKILASVRKPVIINCGAGSDIEILECSKVARLSGIGVGTYFALGSTSSGVAIDIPISLRKKTSN